LLQAHQYWLLKNLAVDLVILNERAASYVQDLQSALETAVRMSATRGIAMSTADRGAVYLLREDLLPGPLGPLLCAVAHVVLIARRGSLADQFDRLPSTAAPLRPARRVLHHHTAASDATQNGPEAADLECFNGLGGFAAEGREYVTRLGPGLTTPAPWINVIANSRFGFQVSAEGSTSTWSLNSREHRLTPWSNDPVCDPSGEAIYLQDLESGETWCPTASPARDPAAYYTTVHGQGYSRFQHESHGLALNLLVFVPLGDPVKITRLTISNRSGRPRRLSVTAYVEWVLGVTRAQNAASLLTHFDPATDALMARNPRDAEYSSRVAFLDMAGAQSTGTADRTEFLGRHGSLACPAALARHEKLSRRTGGGLDPCGVLQSHFVVPAMGQIDLRILLGDADDLATAQVLIERYRRADIDAVLREVTDYWHGILGALQVDTPDRSMDLMLNGWLLYQAQACRMWARTAFYQSSGAYGFRDQLQDSMALVRANQPLAREHLLRAAGRQFPQGDVQHWWLPGTGQGVRTRIVDDRVWLAHAAAHYIERSGDVAVLDAAVGFIEGRALVPDEHDAFYRPSDVELPATLFEHCARGLDLSLGTGPHGLPLFGTGDWNDGMNRVGSQGRGESMWMGWFLYATLRRFAAVADSRGEASRAGAWCQHAGQIQLALEREGWDGAWYRRGFFDDGTPLGSAGNDECRIDSIAQSWAVLSGAADPARAAQAVDSAQTMLLKRDSGLALLFAPPFDRTTLDPGYVKGYPPGLRENGGQYTHAATWQVIALAQLGRADAAHALFSMLNPINRTTTRNGAHRYKVEPYVMAADVYALPPHVGRGGWTWYTGAAGWMYRAGMEALLGLQIHGSQLRLAPCIPATWAGYSATLRHGSAHYDIRFENPHGATGGIEQIIVDGQRLESSATQVDLQDDGRRHAVTVTLGPSGSLVQPEAVHHAAITAAQPPRDP
jgi:cyclic beta-1,2-glucan synthetase